MQGDLQTDESATSVLVILYADAMCWLQVDPHPDGMGLETSGAGEELLRLLHRPFRGDVRAMYYE